MGQQSIWMKSPDMPEAQMRVVNDWDHADAVVDTVVLAVGVAIVLALGILFAALSHGSGITVMESQMVASEGDSGAGAIEIESARVVSDWRAGGGKNGILCLFQADLAWNNDTGRAASMPTDCVRVSQGGVVLERCDVDALGEKTDEGPDVVIPGCESSYRASWKVDDDGEPILVEMLDPKTGEAVASESYVYGDALDEVLGRNQSLGAKPTGAYKEFLDRQKAESGRD